MDDIITQISIGIHLLQHFVLVIVKIEIMVKSNFQLRVANIFNQWICIVPDWLQLVNGRLSCGASVIKADTGLLLGTVANACLRGYVQKVILIESSVIKILQPQFNSGDTRA